MEGSYARFTAGTSDDAVLRDARRRRARRSPAAALEFTYARRDASGRGPQRGVDQRDDGLGAAFVALADLQVPHEQGQRESLEAPRDEVGIDVVAHVAVALPLPQVVREFGPQDGERRQVQEPVQDLGLAAAQHTAQRGGAPRRA